MLTISAHSPVLSMVFSMSLARRQVVYEAWASPLHDPLFEPTRETGCVHRSKCRNL